MTSGSAPKVLIVGVVVFVVGAIVGLTPVTLGDYSCGSAWFPGLCKPGVLSSATTTSTVLVIVWAVAAIVGLVVSNQGDFSDK